MVKPKWFFLKSDVFGQVKIRLRIYCFVPLKNSFLANAHGFSTKNICGLGPTNGAIALPEIRDQSGSSMTRSRNDPQFVFFSQKKINPKTGLWSSWRLELAKSTDCLLGFAFWHKNAILTIAASNFAYCSFKKFFPDLQFWTWWLENAFLVDFLHFGPTKKNCQGCSF